MRREKLLVVDDEKDFVDFISERLEAKGFDILKAYNGRDGFEMARSEMPDLIIMDVSMPGMNGYDVCRNLKTNDNYKDIMIIMLTARFQPNDILFGKEMGSDAYLTKPLELELLLNTVSTLLSSKRRKINSRC